MKHYEVVIIQRRLCDYRVSLFDKLRSMLDEYGINLRLLHGSATSKELKKNDAGYIAWAEELPTKYLFDGALCWQPFFKQVGSADLVIVTQENKLICNLLPLIFKPKYKLAFWGHGKNRQSSHSLIGILKEKFKANTICKVDWWFAYTQSTVNYLVKQGYPNNQITNLNNSIDTTDLRTLFNQVDGDNIDKLKSSLDIKNDDFVGLYIGSLFKDKRLEFLIEACQKLVDLNPNFKLVVIGDGDQKEMIQGYANRFGWIKYVGRKVGIEKASFLHIADVLLNPGMVGLGVLDGFIAGIPLITTDNGLHSPEIDYLKNGVNGVITRNDVSSYVAGVNEVLINRDYRNRLKACALESAEIYTIENMVSNFCDGILKALQQ